MGGASLAAAAALTQTRDESKEIGSVGGVVFRGAMGKRRFQISTVASGGIMSSGGERSRGAAALQ